MYGLIKKYLPDTTLISIGHRNTLMQYHETKLHLFGTGSWELKRIEEI